MKNILRLVPMVGLVMAACAGNGSSDTEAANQLLAQAREACEQANYVEASALLDSLSAAYPHELDARREALLLQPKVIEGEAQQLLLENHGRTEALQQQIDSLMHFFNVVNADGVNQLEGYYQDKATPVDFRSRSTAVSRVNQAGEFIVISSLTSTSVHHTAISLTDAASGATATSGTVAYRGNSDGLSRESVRFSGEAADTLGALCSRVGARQLQLRFIGSGKASPVTLPAAEVAAMARTWQLSHAISELSALQTQRERIEAKLQVARDQQARQQQQ
jgi:hypothetical protein